MSIQAFLPDFLLCHCAVLEYCCSLGTVVVSTDTEVILQMIEGLAKTTFGWSVGFTKHEDVVPTTERVLENGSGSNNQVSKGFSSSKERMDSRENKDSLKKHLRILTRCLPGAGSIVVPNRKIFQ